MKFCLMTIYDGIEYMRLEESCRLRTFVNVSTIRWTMSACRSPKIDIVEDGLVLWGDKGTKLVCSV